MFGSSSERVDRGRPRAVRTDSWELTGNRPSKWRSAIFRPLCYSGRASRGRVNSTRSYAEGILWKMQRSLKRHPPLRICLFCDGRSSPRYAEPKCSVFPWLRCSVSFMHEVWFCFHDSNRHKYRSVFVIYWMPRKIERCLCRHVSLNGKHPLLHCLKGTVWSECEI